MSENVLTVNVDEIGVLTEEGGSLVFSPKAEESILRLLEIKNLVDDALEFVKSKIKEEGLKISDGFKGVTGEKISCISRKYGSKYGYSPDRLTEAMQFIDETTKLNVNTDKVDKFIKENGALPLGIYETDRENQISITMKKEKVR